MFGLIPRRNTERKLAREFEKPFGLMRPEMAELFDRFFGRWPALLEWPVEEIDAGLTVEDREKEVMVRVEVPGFEPGELVVEASGNMLTICGEHKEKEVKKDKEAAERPVARMVRSIMLPVGIEMNKVEALCKNGVLEVHLPKKPEAVTRRIEVKT